MHKIRKSIFGISKQGLAEKGDAELIDNMPL
jgi:hypothetical protein